MGSSDSSGGNGKSIELPGVPTDTTPPSENLDNDIENSEMNDKDELYQSALK